MAAGSTVRPAEVSRRFIRVREAVTAALRSLDQAGGMGAAEQYQALVVARRGVADVYREGRAINHRTELDQTLWFALDESRTLAGPGARGVPPARRRSL